MSDTTNGRMAEPWGMTLDPNAAPPVRTELQQIPQDQSVEDDRLAPKRVNSKRSEKIMLEAKSRAKRAMGWESDFRQRALQDLKFAEADSDNGWQWPDGIRQNREDDNRPSLTINKTRQHCLQVINDAKQNKPTIKFKAVGGGATAQSAQVWEGIARYIEYQSNASTAYDTATEHQVKMGIGYWIVTTDYVSDDSFDQDIYIRRIKDSFTAFLDPDIQEVDGSDAKFGFLITDMLKDDFLETYPQFKNEDGGTSLDLEEGWVDEHHVKVVQYYRVVEEADELISYVVNPETGERATAKVSTLSKEIIFGLKQDPFTRTRPTTNRKVEWYLIAGNRVIEEKPWPGKYVPIVRVIGEESVIEGRLDRKGHVRAMKDPQRMYNYWSSSAVENVALQSKTPYVGPAAAFEGYEEYWKTANRENHAFLPYNNRDDDGNEIAPPQRQPPVTMPDAYLNGMQVASNELMMVSGQYQSQMGQQGNEVSGKAIGERQRQGDNATYHYVDNLAIAIRFTGKIIHDLVPKIYDTQRILRILNEDGSDSAIQINPQMKQPYQAGEGQQEQARDQQRKAKTTNAIMHVLNPTLGHYEVHTDTGPAYSTLRQEAFNAYTQIITQAPALTNLIGDILLKAGDFPMSEEAAERLRRMVPLQALGEAPPPEVIELQTQVQNLTASLTQAIQALGDKAAEMKVAQEKVQIDVFKAGTQRIEKMLEFLSPEALEAIVRDTVEKVLTSNGLTDVERTSEAFLAPPEVPPGADQMMGQADPNLVDPLNAQLEQQQQPAPEGGQDLAQPLGPVAADGAMTEGGLEPQEAIQGMRKAGDGNWYLPDPNRPGKYLQVEG